MNEPTPEEAATALRAVREGKEQVIRSALGSQWIWIGSGLIVFFYCTAVDLFPTASPWLTWPVVAIVLVGVVGLHTRAGSTLLGRPVRVSDRSLPLTFAWRLLRVAPVLGLGIVALAVSLLHLPHGGIYFGALAGLYIMFLSPRFQLWLLRRQDRD
ncbi:hypothetical protein [Rugosimonospora africana]|uniref:Transmembrane protein n=1 Tax=Rugosimonospora africana TaxID=556532 RepID=A0A8J3QUG8_9ACTN|nr:hypothetical protein [Rugosimonospora africana]GIH17700.1 hypothetical protein Raf01_58720 [Rugosimonospora africana]